MAKKQKKKNKKKIATYMQQNRDYLKTIFTAELL